MRRVLAAAVAAAVIAALAVPAQASDPTAEVHATAATTCTRLTLRERVAQVVMTGIPTTRLTDHTARLVERHAGGVILLGHNIDNADQLLRLTRRLRAHSIARMLIAVDEEGGRVSRLGEKGIVDKLPSARELQRTKTPRQIRRLGERLGNQMRRVGMDWNFAPVLDVADAARNTVIGDRAYSGDPDVVASHGGAFARGLQAGGIMTTGKHFPGHGRTTTDSHETLPTITASRSSLMRRDVKPFIEALPSLDAVMTAHVRYTALDRRHPASLSRAATDLLRERLGYRGILVTDALEMGAITSQRTIPQAAERAIRIGADVALIGQYSATPAAHSRILHAVRDGRIRRERLHTAAGRVLAAKGYGQDKVDCLLGR